MGMGSNETCPEKQLSECESWGGLGPCIARDYFFLSEFFYLAQSS